jgi:hypothetical protein
MTRGRALARCKVYEIQGPDPARTAGAVRCHRDVHARQEIDGLTVSVCKRHGHEKWSLFAKDSWVYAVDLNAPVPKQRKKHR